MNTPITPVRIPLDLKEAAMLKAYAEGKDLSCVIKEFLAEYVKPK